MTDLEKLKEQRAALDAQITELTSAARKEAITQIKHLAAQFNIDVATELSSKPRVSLTKSGKGRPVAIKYRDEAGNSWTGRGLKPKWLQVALGAGKPLESFLVS